MYKKEIYCFELNMKFWKFLGVWPGDSPSRYYKYYSIVFITLFVILFDGLLTMNLFFLPRQLDVVIEELLFFFTCLVVVSKVLTFVFMRDKIKEAFKTLQCQIFQPDTDETLKIVENTKRFVKRYWKIIAVVCYTCDLNHFLTPIVAHLFLPVKLNLTFSSYCFIPENIKNTFIYPLYLYQGIGLHFHMLYHIHGDTLLMELMNLIIAQLECLDYKLRHVTDYDETENNEGNISEKEYVINLELKKCIIHFEAISKFCRFVEDIFRVSLFVHLSAASCVICVSLFRFTLPATGAYYSFLVTYIIGVFIPVFVPCWFGSRIMEKSSALSVAAYSCDWISRPREFKSNLRIFVERMNKPLCIVGLKMFPLSINILKKIINTAYSFLTLLRNMQARES